MKGSSGPLNRCQHCAWSVFWIRCDPGEVRLIYVLCKLYVYLGTYLGRYVAESTCTFGKSRTPAVSVHVRGQQLLTTCILSSATRVSHSTTNKGSSSSQAHREPTRTDPGMIDYITLPVTAFESAARPHTSVLLYSMTFPFLRARRPAPAHARSAEPDRLNPDLFPFNSFPRAS